MTDAAVEQAVAIAGDAEALNALVRAGLAEDSLSVAEARKIAASCRHAEGWLVGIRRLLEVEQ